MNASLVCNAQPELGLCLEELFGINPGDQSIPWGPQMRWRCAKPVPQTNKLPSAQAFKVNLYPLKNKMYPLVKRTETKGKSLSLNPCNIRAELD